MWDINAVSIDFTVCTCHQARQQRELCCELSAAATKMDVGNDSLHRRCPNDPKTGREWEKTHLHFSGNQKEISSV